MIFFINMNNNSSFLQRKQLSFEIFFINPKLDLHWLCCCVFDLQIYIVIKHRSTWGKRQHSSRIWENIIGMTMPFDNFQLCMQKHPIQQISQLTKPTSHSACHLTSWNQDSIQKSILISRLSHQFPKWKNFSWLNHYSINFFYCKSQVFNFILLQLHIYSLQFSHNWRLMPHMTIREKIWLPPCDRHKKISYLSLQSLSPYKNRH